MKNLRLADANLNRLGEGLRVLEDVARLYLEDARLFEEIRGLRHRLRHHDPSLLLARRSGEDVGATSEGEGHSDMVGLVRANACRAQEALRVLEELARLPEMGLPAPEYQQARFTLYEMERNLVQGLMRQGRRSRVAGLCLIFDLPSLGGRDPEAVAQQALSEGVKMLQLRDKTTPKGELLPLAQRLNELCQAHGALFLVNDHPDLALASAADGVHLGQRDLPIAEARKVLPQDRLIGLSTATLEEALRAQDAGADYIAVGSIFPTSSKGDARPAGLDTLRRVKEMAKVPVIAIGGINESNISQVIEAGADGAAVLSALLGARDMAAAARGLAQAFKA